ncbi:hypothetical protein ACOSQ3_019478 [Xanthoceras sorbifolium]
MVGSVYSGKRGVNPRINLSLALQTHYGKLVEAAMKVERNATAITQGRLYNKRSRSSSSQSGFSQTSQKKNEGIHLEDIPVVREFPNIFPDDISGLPQIER